MNIVNEYLPAGFYTAGNLNPTFDWEKQQNDYENWDSFGHLRIVSEIEEKFGIKLDIDDIIYITTASGFLKIIKDKMH